MESIVEDKDIVDKIFNNTIVYLFHLMMILKIYSISHIYKPGNWFIYGSFI